MVEGLDDECSIQPAKEISFRGFHVVSWQKRYRDIGDDFASWQDFAAI
jgi:hypothetical protein